MIAEEIDRLHEMDHLRVMFRLQEVTEISNVVENRLAVVQGVDDPASGQRCETRSRASRMAQS